MRATYLIAIAASCLLSTSCTGAETTGVEDVGGPPLGVLHRGQYDVFYGIAPDQNTNGEGTMPVSDLAEYSGTVEPRGACLVLTIKDQAYTPIFAGPTDAAIVQIEKIQAAPKEHLWSVGGRPVKDVGKAWSGTGAMKMLADCRNPPFFVETLSDHVPMPPATQPRPTPNHAG